MKRNQLRAMAAISGILATAGALVYRRYSRDLEAAKARVASGSKVLNTAVGTLEYADVGQGSPVLMIHGAGGGFDQGVEIAQPLIAAGLRVIAPSRFGYLRTPLPKNASPMAQADLYATLLDHLQIEKVLLVGVSAGAPSVLQFCLRYPIRCKALVLGVPLAYSPIAENSADKPSRLREFLINTAITSDFIFWSMSKLAPETMFKTILGTPLHDVEKAGLEEKLRLTEFLSHIEPISERKWGLQNEVVVARSLRPYDLERVKVPTLVFGVENCLYNTYPAARYIAENIPGAQFLSFAEGGHLAAGHQPELWSKVLQLFESAA
jgi:2-hydroxy-6-oxonona-2,4-dienedioate hydrolase